MEQASGAYQAIMFPTTLEVPAHVNLPQSDVDGSGNTAVHYRLLTSTYQFDQSFYTNSYPGMATADLGPYIAINKAKAPDLLVTATNGLGAVAQWKHRPLTDISYGQVPINDWKSFVGCDLPDPFYIASLDAAKSGGYAFFTSSMWTVGKFSVSNGVVAPGVAGMNNTCYRYRDAMLNMEGRGYQGFREIIEEQQFPPAQGENGAGAWGCGSAAEASMCSINNLRTTRDFYQEFPLTSRAKSETVTRVADGFVLSNATHYWYAQQTGPGQPWAILPAATETATYEDSATTPQNVTTNISAQFFGAASEPQQVCTAIAGSGTAASGTLQLTTRSFASPEDTTDWWLAVDVQDKMSFDTSSLDVTAYPVSSSLHGVLSVSGSLTIDPQSGLVVPASSPTAAPACPTPSTNAVTRVSANTWSPAGAAAGSRRRLASQTVQLQGQAEDETDYTYDSYGNVQTTVVKARDLGADPAYPPPNRGTIALPPSTTRYTTGTDPGYFLSTSMNPLGHVSTITTDPKTGKPTSQQPIQGAPRSVFTYDAFGRLIQTTIDDGTEAPGAGTPLAPPRYEALQAGSTSFPLRHIVVQAGAPTHVDYMDVLGRVVASGTQDMQGHEVISQVDYNARGLKLAEHQPLSTPFVLTAATPSGNWNETFVSSTWMTQYSGFDALGRIGQKTVIRDPNSREAGAADANLITKYTYSSDPLGLKTKIEVTRASGDLILWRTYDRRNKLAQTIQQVNAPLHQIPVTYSYDPAGNLTSIVDTKGNTLSATYDELGRKLTVSDPDRGDWSFTYDGVGRLRTTTDSKGTVVAAQYDALGRQERRFVKRAPDGSYRLDANWQYDLPRVGDGAPQPGTLGKMLGAENGAPLDLAAPAFERDYFYDAHLRLVTDTVAVAGVTLTTGEKWDPESLTVGLAYDGNYGRIKGTAYPSGEVVAFDYDSSIGYPIGESPVIAGGGRDPDHQYRRVTAISSRGQITAQHFLNGVSESTTYDDSTGLFLSIAATGLSNEALPAACSAAPYSMVKELAYTYDLFDNLRKQTKTFYLRDSTGELECSGSAVATASASEIYSYDDLQRLTGASRSWTGMTWSPPTTPGDSYSYDDLGNILSKSDYGDTYTYNVTRDDEHHTRLPHAVGSVSRGGPDPVTFSYDANGNLTSGDGRVITFDDFDRPVEVDMGSVKTIFRYAPDGSRYLQQTTTAAGSIKTVYYMGKYYERVDWSDGKQTEEHTYIGPSIAVYQSGSKHDVRYLHLDRLGSVEAVTSSTGAEMPYDAHSFDAFGKPRARDWQAQDKLHPTGDYTATTEHGFTGHEHLDDTYLIHMNGRVYDYRLGRFLSVDPVVSSSDSQALNPYTYIMNNPFSGKDPTGYEIERKAELGSHIMRPTQESVLGAIKAGIANGTLTKETSIADASKKIGADIAGTFAGSGLKFAAAASQPQGTAAGNGAQTQGSMAQSGPTANVQNPAQTASQPASQTQLAGWESNRHPQNQLPTALQDKDGNVVMGANGRPALIPAGFDINKVLRAGKEDRGTYESSEYEGAIKITSHLANFRRGGEWDLQRLTGQFDPRFIDSATILIGMYAATIGQTRDQILAGCGKSRSGIDSEAEI